MTRLVLTSLCLPLAGCVAMAGYPASWAPTAVGDPKCAGLSGTYENSGSLIDEGGVLGPAKDPVLNSLLFVGSGSAAHVKIDSMKPGVLEIKANYSSGDFRGERILLESKGEFACRDGVLLLSPATNLELAPDVYGAGGDRTSLTLSKAADGALIIEEKVVVGGVAMLVFPIAAYKKSWYRFPAVPLQDGLPADLPATRHDAVR